MTSLNACKPPANAEPAQGSRLLLVRRMDSEHGLYLEEELVWEAVELLGKQCRDRTQDCDTSQTNTTSPAQP